MLIDLTTIDAFQTNGVVLLKKIISNYWLEQLSIGIKKNFNNPSKYKCVYEKKENKEIFYDDYCNWQKINEYKEFFFNSGIGNIVAKLIKSKKINIFHEHVLIKESGSEKKTPWHQDQPYYCVNGKDNCSLWIPLDPVPKYICPEFIRGSHKWNKLFLPTKFYGNSYDHFDQEFEKLPDIENNKKDYDIISWKLSPGDAIAFNFATVHGAPANKSNVIRRAFSARFTGDDATYIKRIGETSPPFPELKLKNGDKMDSETFPKIPI